MSEQAYKNQQSGFTAVELLITMFIAAVFLFAGTQLYIQVTKDSSDADKTARMSNLVYKEMREKAGEVSAAYASGCSAAAESGQPTTENKTVDGFRDVVFTTTVDCPYSTTPGALTDVFHITISASYNDGSSTTKTLKHAIYTN